MNEFYIQHDACSSFFTKVTFDCEGTESSKELMAAFLAKGIAEHVQAVNEEAAGVLNIEELEIKITTFKYRNGYLILIMKADGIVNQCRIYEDISLKRKVSMSVPVPTSLLSLAIAPIVMLIEGVAREAIGSNNKGDILASCLTQAISEICIQLDTLSGRQRSGVANYWENLRIVRWSLIITAAVVACVFTIYFSKALDFAITLLGAALLAAIVGGLVFIITYLISLLIMPASFFENEPEGRKAMSLSGVQSVVGMKTVIVLIFLTVTLFIVYLMYTVPKGD